MAERAERQIFVYEYLTGGGDVGDAAAAAELMPLGLSMREALVADLLGLPGWSVCVATAPGVPAPSEGARAVQPLPGESPAAFVGRQAALHDLAWVVAPETGGVLLQLQRTVAAAGRAGWLGCSGPAIDLASSKRATLLRLAGRGVATPLAFEHTAGVTRWVVKPDDGAGGVATRVHGRRDAAWADGARRSRVGAAMVVEPWIDGPALSLSLLCGESGAELLSINAQQITVDAEGVLGYAGVRGAAWPLEGERGAALQALAGRVARAMPGLRGFVGIDLVWHEARGPVVIEVNPRVTCAYVGLSAMLGRNLAGELIDAALRPREEHAGAGA